MIIFGKVENISTKTTKKKGEATIIDIVCPGQWDSEKKTFGPEVTKSVWYFDTPKAKFATWAKGRQNTIGKRVILSATEVVSDGKTAYFGRYLPTTYGMVHCPAELKAPTEEEMVAAATSVEDAMDAGELDESMNVDFQDAESVANAISILAASSSTVAKECVTALRALVQGETNAYIGKLGYAARVGKVFKVSFVTPGSQPAEWNSVSMFGNLADRAEKVLHKGDTAVLIMSEKSEYNGQPSYAARNFIKL